VVSLELVCFSFLFMLTLPLLTSVLCLDEDHCGFFGPDPGRRREQSHCMSHPGFLDLRKGVQYFSLFSLVDLRKGVHDHDLRSLEMPTSPRFWLIAPFSTLPGEHLPCWVLVRPLSRGHFGPTPLSAKDSVPPFSSS